jgi:hypothetical protein
VRAAVILAVAAALSVLAAVAAGAGDTTKVHGTSALYGYACPSSGKCVAVGESTRQGDNPPAGVVVPFSHGDPGDATKVSKTFQLRSVACPRANFCLAVGPSLDGAGEIVAIDHGDPGQPVSLPEAPVAIGCGSEHSCWITASQPEAALIHVKDTEVEHVYKFEKFYQYTFAAGEGSTPTPICRSATRCIGVGHAGEGGPGLVYSIDDGHVKVTHQVPAAAALSSIGCRSGTCRIVGWGTGDTPDGIVFSLHKGEVGKVHKTSDVNYLNAVGCRDRKHCFAFGNDLKGHTRLLPVEKGKPGNATTIDPQVYFARCTKKSCLGFGGVGQFPNATGAVFRVP